MLHLVRSNNNNNNNNNNNINCKIIVLRYLVRAEYYLRCSNMHSYELIDLYKRLLLCQ